MNITPIPAFDDNYIWALHQDGHAIVVDPGDATPVAAWLQTNQHHLTAILVTHHHGDHVGGLAALTREWTVPVFGPANEAIAGITHPVREGDTIRAPGLDAAFTVFDVPGHTAGHVAYYGAGALFCGDTLFAAGCGRLFEGTAAQMHASLGKLARLPPDTRVYCAHEYTQSNLRFALAVEPENQALHRRAEAVAAQRAHAQPSLPTTLANELATNPFLRADQPPVQRAAAAHAGQPLPDPESVFAALRQWKDHFRG